MPQVPALRFKLSAAMAAFVLATLTCGRASAEDPLGLYVGGAVGQSQVRADASGLTTDEFKENHSAFKVMVGLRPLSAVGAELSYVDFGHPSGTVGGFPADATQKGATAFGVLYLPLPLIDLYAKAGLARLESTVNGTTAGNCPGSQSCPPSSLFRFDRTDTSFAAGAGAQVKFGALAVRAEYEHFNAAGANPALVSLGATWAIL